MTSNQSRRTAFRQTEVAGPRQQWLGRRDRQDAAGHGSGRQQRAWFGGHIEPRREENNGAAGIIILLDRIGRMRVAVACVAPPMGPHMGRRAGGEDGEREHQQHSNSGEQPEVGRRERVALHDATDDPDARRFVKREVP
jgi:hypothetical protein